MPLLGRKLFDYEIVNKKEENDNEVYVIPHTNEKFYSEKEYKQRVKLYEQKIWSCQCTGHVNLTHLEAAESENLSRKRLADFDEIWEAPILSVVQHSYSLLDNIILEAYKVLMTNLIPGEKVSFVVKNPDKCFDATIVKRYDNDNTSSPDEGKSINDLGLSNTTTSPSSDKENKTRQALITDVFKSDTRRSPRKPHFIRDFPLKKQKLKLLPKSYDILLADESKIVSKVPCENLTRIQKPPNKDMIRLFVRANAVRLWGGKDMLPWVVDEKMVAKHSLISHIESEEESRMRSLSTVSAAQLSLDGTNGLNSNLNHVNKNSLTNGIGSSTDRDEDDDDLSLADVKKSGLSKKVRGVSSTKKSSKSKADKKSNKSKDARGKNKVARIKSDKPSGMELFLKKMGKPSVKSRSKQSNKNDGKMIVIDDDDDNRPLSVHINSSFKSSRKSSTPRKKKQATLLELTKKGSGIKLLASPSPSKTTSSSKPRKPRQPVIVIHLLSLKKEKKFRVYKYKLTIAAACKILTEKQRENLPPEIKDDVMKKWEMEDRKRKFQNMTPEERRAFLARERKAKRENEFPKKEEKYEDLHLPRTLVKSLPDFELLGLPESLPNTSFGDLAMICEFLHSYHALLCPKDPSYHKQFNIQTVSDAVTAGKAGFGITRKIVVVMLQLLLGDDIAKDYSELDFPLNTMLVTPEVSCELTRICLRHHDDDLDDTSETGSNIDVVDTGLTDSTSRRLFEMELYEMDPVEQIEILSHLAYRVMNTYAVQIYMEDTMLKATTIWNKVIKQGAQRRKEEKEQKQEMEEKKNETNSDKQEAENNEKSKEIKKNNKPLPLPEDTSLDLVSRVKQRKLLSEQHKKEEAERRERLKKEQDELFEKQKTIQEREKTKKQLAETRMMADHVRRRVPLGTDRNHSRYWLFCDGVPGLYVEKGWVGDYIDYCTQSDPEPIPCSPSKSPQKSVNKFDFNVASNQGSLTIKERLKASSLDDDDELPLSHLNSPSKKKARFRRSKEEASWPRPGQNMWMSVDSQEQLDQLMANLSQSGVRESKLRRSLEKNYESLVRTINKKKALYERVVEPVSRRSALPSDGDELLRNMSIKHLQTMIRDACRGSLAEIEEPDVFEQRIATLESASQFGAALLEFFRAIPKKFLGHYMTGISDKKKKRVEITDTETPSERERVKAERRVEKWKQAVEDVTLYSRLCFLISILSNSIRWDLYQHRHTASRRRVTRIKNYADVEESIDEEEEEEEDEESEESEEDEAHRRSSRIKEKKRTRPVKEQEEASDESEDEDLHRRSSRIKKKRKAVYVEEDLPVKRTRKRPVRYQVNQSDEDENEEEDSDDNNEENHEEENKSASSEESYGEEEEVEEEEDVEDESVTCRHIIEKLMKYQYSEMFRDPVDTEVVPDYYEIVTSPICLGDILNKIDVGEQETAENGEGNSGYGLDQILEDMKLLLGNASLYNAEDSFVMKQASKLENAFVRLFRDSTSDPARNKRLRSMFKSNYH